MHEWHRLVSIIIAEIDECIRRHDDEALTLRALSRRLGYSEYHFSRKFHELSGMSLRDYLRYRRLAFALREVRESTLGLLDIAVRYGFSSHEAFTRAFREAYGITPSEYRAHPIPAALRTIIRPFDCYLTQTETAAQAVQDVRVYFVTIPGHRFLHIRDYESIGYWDFWQRQSRIPGHDCETVCRLLDGISGKLDDEGGDAYNSSRGQLMAWLNDASGRLCSWGIPLAECYGVRLPADYTGDVPTPLQLLDVPEGAYIVFEHGPFDFETENGLVEEKIERAMKAFDFTPTGYTLDLSPGRIFYHFHDPARFWKYVRPVYRRH